MTRHPYHRLTSPRRVGAIRRLQELVERISDDTTYNVAESSVLSWLSTATGYTLTAVADIATYMKPSEARVQYAALITAAMVGAISPLGNYAANDVVPATVLDFENDVYAGTVSAFSDLSFAATSNATVIDSDGVLKWRAHNFVLSSNIFNGAGWINQGTVTDTDGEWSELTFSGGGTNRQLTGILPVVGAKYTAAVELRAGTLTAASVSILFSGAGLGFTTTNATLTSEGQLVSATQVVPAGTPDQLRVRINVSEAGTIWVRYARVHRSDLGGMANNPDTGNSYVPTTTAAVYLPRFDYATGFRRLLIEPTASTNAYLSSGEITSGDWTNTNLTVTPDAAVSPTGETDATKLEATATASTELRQDRSLTDKATVSVWWKQGPSGSDYGTRLQLRDQSLGVTLVTATFDPSTETFSYITGSSGGTFYAYPNGWYRIALSVTFSGTKLIRASLFNNGANSDAGDDCYVYGPQLEPTTEVTSYIPTAGSSATRAAETRAIPAAKIADYQTPTYIGDELVTNGTFDTDLTAWTATGGDGTAAWDAGTMRLTNGSSSGYMTQGSAFTTESGKVYEVTFDVDLVNNIKVFISNASNGTAAFADSGIKSASGTYSFVFVATAATTYVYAQMATSLAGATAAFDNVSVREINPLAVSFAMSGEMTYADNDSTLTATMLSWQGPVGNSIIWYLTTSGSYTGALRASHAANSVWEADQSPNPGYTPGVNVPVSFAYRATSTTAQAAAAGAAGAVNNTLLGLFDGSIRNISLAYSGGPMRIAKFIMWNEDIGQTGIEEATA